MADKKSELKEVKMAGGKAQKNSGRGTHDKADGILEPFCFDVKEYEKSYSISIENWSKICTDAFRSGRRVPALKIVLGKDTGPRTRLWVIGDSMFAEMLSAWKEKYGDEEAGAV